MGSPASLRWHVTVPQHERVGGCQPRARLLHVFTRDGACVCVCHPAAPLTSRPPPPPPPLYCRHSAVRARVWTRLRVARRPRNAQGAGLGWGGSALLGRGRRGQDWQDGCAWTRGAASTGAAGVCLPACLPAGPPACLPLCLLAAVRQSVSLALLHAAPPTAPPATGVQPAAEPAARRASVGRGVRPLRWVSPSAPRVTAVRCVALRKLRPASAA